MKRVHKVWGQLGKIMGRKGADTQDLEMLYRAMVQVVLLFGLVYWVLPASIKITVEGTHTGFLRQIM